MENGLPHCCGFLLYAQSDVRSGDVMQKEDLIHLPARPNPYNSLFKVLLSKNSNNEIPSLYQKPWLVSRCGGMWPVSFSPLQNDGLNVEVS